MDIVDSIITHAPLAHMQAFHMQLKADLFTVLAADTADIAGVFYKYSYPNVGEANRVAFIGDLLQRLEDRASLLGEFEFQVLKGVLQAGADPTAVRVAAPGPGTGLPLPCLACTSHRAHHTGADPLVRVMRS